MKVLVLTLGAVLLPLAAAAAEPDASRFQLERSGDHFVRLDRQTGAMSICQDKDGALVCRMAADERAAYEDELDRLSQRVTKLEQGGLVQRAGIIQLKYRSRRFAEESLADKIVLCPSRVIIVLSSVRLPFYQSDYSS